MRSNLKLLDGLIGALGVVVIILSIMLFGGLNTGLLQKSSINILLQVFIGLLFLVFGIKENKAKGKQRGNIYFAVSVLILVINAYNIYTLYTKL